MKSTPNIHWKDWCWSWSFNTLATWRKELTHWERPWCLQGLKVGGEGDNREWRRLDGITDSMDMSLSELQEMVKDREAGIPLSMGSQRDRKPEQLNWADDYTMEVTNSFKVTDLVGRVPEELKIEVDRGCTRCSDQNHPKNKEMQEDKIGSLRRPYK